MLIHRISWKVLKILAYIFLIRIVLMDTRRFVSRKVKVIVLPLTNDSHSIKILNISSRATGQIVTKFYVGPAVDEETIYDQTAQVT